MRRALVLIALALVVPGSAASAREAHVAIFYYPWYGTPARDGAFIHWGQRGFRPPDTVASAFYPARRPYSSSDPRVLAAHMREIAAAGVDQVVTSWWGPSSREDRLLRAVTRAARRAGLDVGVHLEPYPGRTPASSRADIDRLMRIGISEFYVYGPHDATAPEWGSALAGLSGARVFAQTVLAGFASAGGFDGLYTYDVLVHGGAKFARVCEQARRLDLVCAPSVGPGYDARRAVGDPRTKRRRAGRTYDSMWKAALAARADRITITSYNEWHEGTQIEPARPHRSRRGLSFLGYDGAWAERGAAAERAYLERTSFWARRFRAAR